MLKAKSLCCSVLMCQTQKTEKKAEPMVETDFRSLIIIIVLKVHPQNIGCFLLMRAFKDAPDVSKGIVGEILTLG